MSENSLSSVCFLGENYVNWARVVPLRPWCLSEFHLFPAGKPTAALAEGVGSEEDKQQRTKAARTWSGGGGCFWEQESHRRMEMIKPPVPLTGC